MKTIQKILETLKIQESPITIKQLKKLTGFRNQAFIASVKSLLNSGQITRLGTGIKCSPYLYLINPVQTIEVAHE